MKKRVRRMVGILLALMLVLALIPASAMAVEVIDKIELTGITATLTPDEKPAFTAALSDESAGKMEINTESWSDMSTSPPTLMSSDYDGIRVVIAGHYYEYGIDLSAKSGYVFDESTKLVYDGKTYDLTEIGYTFGGSDGTDKSEIQLWNFFDDVIPPADDLKNMTIDLTKGAADLTPSQFYALGAFLDGANEVGQVSCYTLGGETRVDLDLNGSDDVAFSVVSVNSMEGRAEVMADFSLTEDLTLTLNEEAVTVLENRSASPYAETVTFKFKPAERPYTLDLSKGAVTLVNEDEITMVLHTMEAAEANNMLTYAWNNDGYDIDLDLDGTADIHEVPAEDWSTVEFYAMENASVTDKAVLEVPLIQLIQAESAGFTYYYSPLTIMFTAATEAAKDLGACTIDLSKGPATKTPEEFAAIQATLAGMDIKGRGPATAAYYDFDMDGKEDLKIEKQTDDSAIFSLLETTGLTGDTTLTATDEAIARINEKGLGNYYKTITVKLPNVTEAKDLGSCSIDLSKAPATKTPEEFAAIQATLSGLASEDTIKARTEGTVTYYDLDKDGKEDMKAEKQADDSAIFSLLETWSLSQNAVLTATDKVIAYVNTEGLGAYYKTVTVQIPLLEAPPPATNPFVDVSNGQYYFDAVLWAVEKNVTKGTDDTHFSPDATCTRGQVVTFLWRAAGSPAPGSSTNPFTDVKSGDYYYDAVLWAVEKNITKGTSATTFSPDQPCTRAQVVTFLHRFENTPAPGSSTNPFGDVTAGAYYYNAVLWAVEKNITNGTDATHFSPDSSCTRGQIVTFLYRDMK
ncbi:MAG: S-layer homology domain-containing protein [Oscillospiraceae bacterium]|nr:S-layer homology domain-containing protein [Oscillospiraceae bacterium]